MSYELSVPVLVVGAGACGTVAALAASDAGAEVLLIEQEADPRGTTSLSQGLICAAGTRAQAEAGIDDDADRFFDDIMAKVRGQTDPILARAIADHAGPCIDWLVDAHDLPYTLDIRFRPAYGHTRARVHGWLGRGGLDLVQVLHARVAARGIDVLTQARLADVIADADGRVEAAVIARPDGSTETIGCGALVLAAGGFGANAEMVRRWMPDVAHARFNGHEGNHGDAMRIGAQLGASLADMGAYQGYGMLTEPQAISVPPGIAVEGGILVDRDGRRFVDESADIAGMVHDVLARPDGLAWVIYDAAIEARCDYIPETQQLIAMKAPRRADTIDELARAIGVEAATLQATLAAVHAAAAQGIPDPVGRSWTGGATPPQAGYRALKVTGALYHTQGGIQIDGDGRALRADGTPLPNLYAGGGSARCVSGPSSWGYLPAMGLCSAVTFGMTAGRAAASAGMR
jgi:fumarate reductase flavoprotein subunit